MNEETKKALKKAEWSLKEMVELVKAKYGLNHVTGRGYNAITAVQLALAKLEKEE